jgi:membrane protease YdiL (CAAX protease family)
MAAIATGLLAAAAGFDPGRLHDLVTRVWPALVAQTAAGLMVFGVLTWAIGMRALKLTARDLRWSPRAAAAPGFLRGLGLGALAAAGTFALSALLGGAHLAGDGGGLGAYLGALATVLLLLFPAALLEELMFRGVVLVTLARFTGRSRAVVAIAVLFALAHIRNPNTTALGLLNIGLAGVLLGAAFYLPGGIWAAWGAHLGWNATLAAADAPVSGLPIRLPLVDYEPGGPAWLTGGAFGPEGGLAASLAITGAIAMAVRWTERRTI